MPTNTLGGVNLAALAERSLDTLVDVLPRLQVFSTDFSADIATAGESVSTRVATQPSSASLATGYATNAQNSTTTAKTVTLGAVTGSVLGFNDAEWSKSNINLYDIFIKPGINAVANDMIDDALALITSANFSTAAFTGASAGFDEDDVADIGKVLTDAKVPKGNRSMVLSTAYYNALLKRDAVKLAYAIGGTEAIRQGVIPNISGFQVMEYTDIPSNSENLVGFACSPQGIIIAARSPAVPANFPGEIMDVTEPDSGFTLQLRKWYSADDGQYYLSMAAMWGVAVGVAGNLKRIVSA
jgi:hypothetical protein